MASSPSSPRRYPFDLTDKQWTLLQPLLPRRTPSVATSRSPARSPPSSPGAAGGQPRRLPAAGQRPSSCGCSHHLGPTLERRLETVHLESHRRGHHRQDPTRPRHTPPDQIDDGPLAGLRPATSRLPVGRLRGLRPARFETVTGKPVRCMNRLYVDARRGRLAGRSDPFGSPAFAANGVLPVAASGPSVSRYPNRHSTGGEEHLHVMSRVVPEP